MKKIIIISLAIAVLFSFAACGANENVIVVENETKPQETAAEPEQETADEAEPEAAVYDVEAAEFEAQMNGNYVLLDVRTQEEYDTVNIKGAMLIPVDELTDRWQEIDEYDKVLVYCRSGNRSVTAANILIDAGFKQVYNLLGGITAWSEYKS